jgi:hypothetical protein
MPFSFWSLKDRKEEFPSLVDFSKDIKKKRAKDAMAWRLIEWNNDHTSYSFILSLYHHLQKMMKRTKKSVVASIIDEKWVGTTEDVDHDHFSCH